MNIRRTESKDGLPVNRWTRPVRLTIAASLAIAATVTVSEFLPAGATAANNGLTIAPPSGQTLTGGLTFTVPTPGCPASGTASGTVVTLTGPGVTPTNDDNSTNINAAQPATRGTAITMDTGGVSWDGIALDKSLPRPLNGTYTVKLQCMEDGEATGQSFFDREVTFTGSGAAGSPGTWSTVVQGTPTPTPVPGTPTPTPVPGPPTPTPVPGTPTPTPTPVPATPTPTPAPGPNNSANQSVPAGGELGTNSEVTPGDPIGTTVKSPVAGQVSITEGTVPSGTAPPTGFSLLGQQVSITAPTASADAPLRLQFRLDSSLIGGGPVPTVFRNGVPVLACTNLAQPAAAPDPCVEPMQNLGGGDLLLTVRTSAASTWNFGRPFSPPPPKDIAAACRAGAPVPAGWTLREGTAGDDVLIGTAGADIIRGLAGEDTLVGSSGNDVICAGAGDDLISGNTGHDLLLGEGGDDAIYGGAGDDAIGGGTGNDNLNGGLGDDLITGGSGRDLIFGGRDDDLLYGDAGNDHIYGEDGSDRLYGGAGYDVLVVGRRY